MELIRTNQLQKWDFMRIPIVAFIMMFLFAGALQAQDSSSVSLPSVKIKDIDGNVINTADLGKDGKPVVLSFWATWCKPCLQELQTYHGLYDEWSKELGATVYAISIDDSRNAMKVPGFAKGRNWKFPVLLDQNQDFKRAMNVNNVPHTFIVMNGKVVWSHSAFAPGDEEDVEAELKKLVSNEG